MSFTHIPTKSNPKYSSLLKFIATHSFVPTPSVLLSKIGSLYFSFFKSKREQKPPLFSITSLLMFFEVIFSILFTNFEVLFVSTPEDLYVILIVLSLIFFNNYFRKK